jgi:hypothetical protein
MTRRTEPPEDPIAAWRSIVPMVRAHVTGRTEAQLDQRLHPDAMTPRELVHHIAEANAVAVGIVIAALGSPGAVFDWSWLLPFGPWMDHMQYAKKPIAPSLRLLEALNDYVVAQVQPLADGLQRVVLLRDQPGAEPRRATVAEVLLYEVAHAREHLAGKG